MSAEKLRALLAEARGVIDEGYDRGIPSIIQRIDAALAEPVVEPAVSSRLQADPDASPWVVAPWIVESVKKMERERDEARAEAGRLKKAMEDRWFECHDGSESACCKSHE